MNLKIILASGLLVLTMAPAAAQACPAIGCYDDGYQQVQRQDDDPYYADSDNYPNQDNYFDDQRPRVVTILPERGRGWYRSDNSTMAPFGIYGRDQQPYYYPYSGRGRDQYRLNQYESNDYGRQERSEVIGDLARGLSYILDW